MSARLTHRPFTVAALLLAMFLAAAEMTVVATAMPTAAGDLGGVNLYAWVFAAYMLAATVTVPLYSKLADLYGRKPVMMIGLGLFVVASAACGQARTMTQLIAFRALQGLGAGAIQPVSLTIVGDLFTVEQRAKIQGVFGAVWGVAGLAGPLLGGLIVKYASWRWVFYFNLPFGIGSAVILTFFFHENIERRRVSLDVLGAFLLSVAVVAVLAISRAGTVALVAVPVAVAATIALLVVERRAAEPLLPLSLFARPVIATASASGALIGAAMIAYTTYAPLYVQAVLGGTPTQSGTAIAPMAIGWPIASALSGRLIVKVGVRPLVRTGFAVAAVAACALAFALAPGVNLHVIQALSALFGVGLGLANTALIIAVQSSVPWQQRGVATGSTMFFRTIGGTLSVGLLGGLLAARLGRVTGVAESAVSELLGPTHGRTLTPSVIASLSSALEHSMTTIFWVVAMLAAAAFAVGLLFPSIRLEGKPKAEPVIAE